MKMPPNEKLLDTFREAGPCEHCRKWCQRREPHHLKRKGMGGASRLDIKINLAGLCFICHRMEHDGNIPTRLLLEIVAKRERRTPESIEQEIWDLLRKEK